MDNIFKREFSNLLCGNCYVIDESENNYLVYAPKGLHKFIVCSYLDEMGAMMNQVFFDELSEAREKFEEKKEKNNGRIL